jgi:nucleotidyltransferase/DNA polymerase involved in DNA repair
MFCNGRLNMTGYEFLFFDMNSFYASVAQAEEPVLTGRPVGILTTDSRYATCIAASVEAKRAGVKMGTKQEDARRMCPGIVFRVVKHDVCVHYHHKILAAVDTILPVDRVWSIDECSCRLTASQQNLSEALILARLVQNAILTRVSPALRCSIGIAPTRLLAKIAAGLEKPGGMHWLSPDVLPQKISHLDLDDLPGIAKNMAARLQAAGISSIEQLYRLEPKAARLIWKSVAGERFIRELRGESVEWPETKRSMIGHGQVLTRGNRSVEGARLVARRLLVKAASRLRREDFFARSLAISVKCETAGRVGYEGRIKATQDSLALLDTFDRYWASLYYERPMAVNVFLGGLIKSSDVPRDLFDVAPTAQQKKSAPLSRMVDKLNLRFGQNTVRYGQLPPHHVPYTGAKIAFGRIPDTEDFFE